MPQRGGLGHITITLVDNAKQSYYCGSHAVDVEVHPGQLAGHSWLWDWLEWVFLGVGANYFDSLHMRNPFAHNFTCLQARHTPPGSAELPARATACCEEVCRWSMDVHHGYYVTSHMAWRAGGQFVLLVAVTAAFAATFTVAAHGGFPFSGHCVLIVSRARHSSHPLRALKSTEPAFP